MTEDAIMTMVERELKARPDISSSDLHAKIAKKHAGARKLTTRQFHARYPLRVKKRWSLETEKREGVRSTRRRRAAKRPKKQSGSDGKREILVRFADELLQMRDPSFTSVLSRVDHYAELLDEK